MLKQLGRLERTRNIIILGFAVLMAVSLIIFYAPGRNATSLIPPKIPLFAKVALRKSQSQMLPRFARTIGRCLGPNKPGSIGGNKRFLDGLISKHVIAQEAERLGLGASDGELREKIMKQFSDASGQFIGFDRYKESVTAALVILRSLRTTSGGDCTGQT
jgi:peptidyl-prolyl cis-trans isomerase D